MLRSALPVPLALLLACRASGVVVEATPSGSGADSAQATTGATDTDPTEQITGTDDDTGTATGARFEHLPVLIIDPTRPITDGDKVAATLQILEEHDGTLTDLDAAPRAFSGAIGIEVHGSSSTGYPKLGYKFECREKDGSDDDCALVGLPAGSDWVLHAPYSDKTYLRNALAYAAARAAAADWGAWEVRTQHVELVLDGDYVGIYLLVERVSPEDDRLVLPPTTDPKDGSVDGGFVVKVDQHRSAGFDTARGTPLDWSEPKQDAVTRPEADYLLSWFDRMEAALAAESFADPVSGYSAWIDVNGWIDHFLANELTHNIDAYRLSSYLWTDGPPGTSVMHAGPVWDFDRAWGNVNYCDCERTEGWIIDDLTTCGYGGEYPFWWERLAQDPAWRGRVRARWEALRAGAWSDAALLTMIDDYRQQVAEAMPRDQDRWGTIGTHIDPNSYVGATWEDELTFLADWTLARTAWLDAHVGE